MHCISKNIESSIISILANYKHSEHMIYAKDTCSQMPQGNQGHIHVYEMIRNFETL